MEYWWNYTLNTYGETFVTSTGAFIIHEIAYICMFLPFMISDYIPVLRRYKIQSNITNTYMYTFKAYKRVILTHVLIELPMLLLFHGTMTFKHFSISSPLPSWYTVIYVCIISLILEDFYFYWMHRLLHHKFLYKYIHKIHHEYTAPFGFCAEYAHPVETLVLGIGSVIGPLLYADHYFTIIIWLILRVFQTVEAHSGYDFPWSPRYYIPLWGGAKFHDMHHKVSNCNYASTFTIWDRVFGTIPKEMNCK